MHDRDFEHIPVAYEVAFTGRKMDLHKFYSRRIFHKIVTKLKSKCEANAKFVSLFTTQCFGM